MADINNVIEDFGDLEIEEKPYMMELAEMAMNDLNRQCWNLNFDAKHNKKWRLEFLNEVIDGILGTYLEMYGVEFEFRTVTTFLSSDGDEEYEYADFDDDE